MTDGGLLKVAALYRKTDKRGATYLAGSFGMLRISVMKNGYKQNDNDPDYYLCYRPYVPGDGQQRGTDAPQAGHYSGGAKRRSVPATGDVTFDAIPAGDEL